MVTRENCILQIRTCDQVGEKTHFGFNRYS